MKPKETLIITETHFIQQADCYLVGERVWNGQSNLKIVITNLLNGKKHFKNVKRKLFQVRGANKYCFDYLGQTYYFEKSLLNN